MKKNNAASQYDLHNNNPEAVRFSFMQWGLEERGHAVKPHRHHFHEILVFAKGNGTHDIDFNTYKASSGSVHFVAADNVHLLLRDRYSSGYSLLFSADYLPEELIFQLPFSGVPPVMHLQQAELEQLHAITAQIKSEQGSSQSYAEDMIKVLLETFVLHLLRIHNNKKPVVAPRILPHHLTSFKELIGQFSTLHYSVEVYAEKLGISAKHFIELCKKHTGKTPLKHIQEYVVGEAKKRLFHTSQTIREIADDLKFSDPANFSKYFKAVSGYTPAEYRKGIR